MGRLEGRTARNAEPVDPAIGTTHMCQCIVECGLLTGTRSAEGIMASGHVNRINRPNTWLHRPTLRREDLTCQPGAVHTWHFPTLLISGTFDTLTSLAGAKAAAAKLSNATIISIPGIGHFVSPWSPCAQAVIVSFLADPTAPDTSCVGALKPPSFTSA